MGGRRTNSTYVRVDGSDTLARLEEILNQKGALATFGRIYRDKGFCESVDGFRSTLNRMRESGGMATQTTVDRIEEILSEWDPDAVSVKPHYRVRTGEREADGGSWPRVGRDHRLVEHPRYLKGKRCRGCGSSVTPDELAQNRGTVCDSCWDTLGDAHQRHNKFGSRPPYPTRDELDQAAIERGLFAPGILTEAPPPPPARPAPSLPLPPHVRRMRGGR